MFFHNKPIWMFFTLTLALGLTACASVSTPEPVSTPQPTFTPLPPSPTSEPMALTVNGEGITVVEFNEEVQRYIAAQNGLGNEVSSSDAASEVIQNYIAELVLSQAARADGFTLDDVASQVRIDALAA